MRKSPSDHGGFLTEAGAGGNFLRDASPPASVNNVVYLDERFKPAPVIRLRAKTGPAEEKAYVRRGAEVDPDGGSVGGAGSSFDVDGLLRLWRQDMTDYWRGNDAA